MCITTSAVVTAVFSGGGEVQCSNNESVILTVGYCAAIAITAAVEHVLFMLQYNIMYTTCINSQKSA